MRCLDNSTLKNKTTAAVIADQPLSLFANNNNFVLNPIYRRPTAEEDDVGDNNNYLPVCVQPTQFAAGANNYIMADLRAILDKTISQNPDDQRLALEFLNSARENNFAEFIRQLSDILADLSAADFARQQAGLQIKNSLVAKDDDLKVQYIERWMRLPADLRTYVKQKCFGCLGTEHKRPSIAAQCVAAVACAELPVGAWPDIITLLMSNVTKPDSAEMMKESSLETLGYICQDIDALVLVGRANDILTAIVHGMRKQEPSNHVRLAATTALYNSLEFTKPNFDSQDERNIIMQVVCEATQSEDARVKVSALQCLVRIMSLYYQYMEPYMANALFPISLNAMQSTNEEICLQGIEFWSNVAEEEINLAVEAEEAEDEGRAPEHVSKHYAKGAMQHLIPILTACLARQEEGDDEDDWNVHKAASVCVSMLAQLIGDDIVPATLPFITQNIQSSDWRYKEAAIMAFGSIMEGPDVEQLKGLTLQALPFLLDSLKHPMIEVRDTVAWCLGRVCETCHEVVVQPDVLQPMLPALSTALQQEPRVAANVCWALSSLATAAYEAASSSGVDETGQPETYILSSCFDAMVSELLKTTDRTDGHSSNLRIAGYETLMELIKNSPKDCYTTVQQTTLTILKKLQQLLSMEAQLQSNNERSQFRDLQSLLCATLQSVVRKLRPTDAPLIADDIMNGLFLIMQRCEGKENSGVMEDALIAVSAEIEVLGHGFKKYMPTLKPFLVYALQAHGDADVCQAAVGVVADLCRAFEADVVEYMDELMLLLHAILQNAAMEKACKSQVLSVFGDIALATGPQFVRYAEPVLAMLQHASLYAPDNPSDLDELDYQHALQASCLEAYTGIVQGLRAPNGASQNGPSAELVSLQPHVTQMIQLLERIAVQSHVPESVLSNAAGLIGDLVSAYGVHILAAVESPGVQQLLMRTRKAKSTKTKAIANWALKEIRKLKAPQA